MSANCDIAFTLNGVKRELSVPAGMSALAMLRERRSGSPAPSTAAARASAAPARSSSTA